MYYKLLNFYGDFEFNYFIHISIKNKIVYFEIPKTGCTTIKNILLRAELGQFEALSDGFNDSDVHSLSSSVLLRPFNLNPSMFDEILNSKDFFKFAIVRDPVERLLSAYLDKISRNSNESFELVTFLQSRGVDAAHFLQDENVIPIPLFLNCLNDMNSSGVFINSHMRLQKKLLPIDLVNFDKIFDFNRFNDCLEFLADKLNYPLGSMREYGGHSVNASEKVKFLSDVDRAAFLDYVLDDVAFFDECMSLNSVR